MLRSLTLCNDASMETSNKITGESIMANVMNAFGTAAEQAVAKPAVAPVARKKAEGKPAQPRHPAVAPVRISALYGHNPKQNQLLGALPDEDFERLPSIMRSPALPHPPRLHFPPAVESYDYPLQPYIDVSVIPQTNGIYTDAAFADAMQ
ncbi:MAG TPA: hypothetical protein VF797_16425 [Noviherbaspirillum sp.]